MNTVGAYIPKSVSQSYDSSLLFLLWGKRTPELRVCESMEAQEPWTM